jgi:hypothetical protein
VSRQGNNLDVCNRVDVTSTEAVATEVGRIFARLYPGSPSAALDRAFGDLDALYRGRFPGFHACDTPYHDIQHVLDVTLAMARLMDGHERKEGAARRLGESLFRLGVVVALFHDVGYVRGVEDAGHSNGAELTLTHVSRGARFLESYLPLLGMGDAAATAAALIHFTGYEIPVAQIPVASSRHRRLGCLLGSADIVAQMADRCYLEKCRDRLYPEFLAAGIARRQLPDGGEDVVFASGYDLVMKTPRFFEGAARRLDEELAGNHHYGNYHFGGRNVYLEEVQRNVRFAEAIERARDTSALRRVPPETLDTPENES